MKTRQIISGDIYKQSNVGKVGGVVGDLWRVQIVWNTVFGAVVSNPSWQFTLIPLPFKLGKLVYAHYFASAALVGAGNPICFPFSSYLSIPQQQNPWENLDPTVGGATPGTTTKSLAPVFRFQRQRESVGIPQEGIDFRVTGQLANVQLNWVGDTGIPVTAAGAGSQFVAGDSVAANIDLRFEILDI